MAIAALVLGVVGMLVGALMYQACVFCHRDCGQHDGLSPPLKCWSDADCRNWKGEAAPYCVHRECVSRRAPSPP
jgi:hypothetical protein